MEIRLRSVLRNPQLPLIVKAILFGGFLALAKIGNMQLFPILFFLAITLFLYAKPLFRTLLFLTPLFFLVTLAILMARAAAWEIFALLVIPAMSFLFYLLLGIKQLVFVRRELWLRVMYLSFGYASMVLFFAASPEHRWSAFVALLVGLFLLLRGMFSKQYLSSVVLLLLLAEAVWGISLLPFGPIHAASAAFLIYFFVTDLVWNVKAGTLTRHILLIDSTIFIFLAFIIAATTRWAI